LSPMRTQGVRLGRSPAKYGVALNSIDYAGNAVTGTSTMRCFSAATHRALPKIHTAGLQLHCSPTARGSTPTCQRHREKMAGLFSTMVTGDGARGAPTGPSMRVCVSPAVRCAGCAAGRLRSANVSNGGRCCNRRWRRKAPRGAARRLGKRSKAQACEQCGAIGAPQRAPASVIPENAIRNARVYTTPPTLRAICIGARRKVHSVDNYKQA
jgi:hypothetical protein